MAQALSGQVDLSTYTNPNVLATFGPILGQAGVDPTTVSAAQAAYSALPDSVQGAVGDVLDAYHALPANIKTLGGDVIAQALHGNVNPTSMMPLVSMSLALVPGVGAPMAGILAAATPLIGAVANLLDGEHPRSTDVCAWIVRSTANPDPSWINGGSMQMPMSDDDMKKHGYTPESFGCFNKKRPYGPTDPAWVKFAAYAKKNQKMQGNGHIAVLAAFSNQMPGWVNDWSIIFNDLRDLANAGNKDYFLNSDDGRKFKMVAAGQKTDWYGGHSGPGGFYGTMNAGALWTAPLALRQFAALYFYMWQANAEMAINGHKFASDKDVLVAALQAWNLHHRGGPTVTIKPGDKWFVGYLLNGDIDGNDSAAITIPTALIAPPPPARKNLAFHLGQAIVKPPSKVPPRPITSTPQGHVVSAPEPWWKKYAPYAPVAAGAALFPVLGPLAPIAGGMATVWMKIGKK